MRSPRSEANLKLMKAVDWIIDLGRGVGDDGGQVVVAGRPEEVAAHPTSYTGQFLRRML